MLVSNTPQRKFHSVSINDYDIACVERTPIIYTRDKISIGVLTSSTDVDMDMTEDELKEAHQKYSEHGGALSRWIRKCRPKTRGLLLIYLPAYKNTDKTYGLEGNETVGFAVSFPESDTAEPIEYVVNSVYAEESI